MFNNLIEQVDYHIVVKTAEEIDKKGLSNCIKESLEEIIEHFGDEQYLYDGSNKFNCVYPKLEVLVKADAKVKLVGAASIIAKVIKDRKMIEHSKTYPEYGFETNSGYGTKKHIQAIKDYGYTPIHRKSYKVKELEEDSGKKTTDLLF